jgi:hypothetical protein
MNQQCHKEKDQGDDVNNGAQDPEFMDPIREIVKEERNTARGDDCIVPTIVNNS